MNSLGFGRANSAIAGLSILVAAGLAPGQPAMAASARPLLCDDSLRSVFQADSQTQVVLVKPFKKGAPVAITEPVTPITPKAAADLCLVKLIVSPGNPGPEGAPSTSPGIGIEVWLPTPKAWNGRIHNIGGRGGYDGGLHASSSAIGWPYAATTAGSEGAVSSSTDSGHAPIDGSWAMNPDGTPNRQGWVDFSHRAQHEVAVKSKALARAYYGHPHSYAYYEGISTGGRHGYKIAQQYPDDYDGIIASLPTIYFQQWALTNFYRNLVIERDLGGVPLTEEQQDLVSNAAIGACDMVGGKHMGYIIDNAACRYDPTQDRAILCKADGGSNMPPHCVSKLQANAVNKFWYGITIDGSVPAPADDNGVDVALSGKQRWYGFGRGTSLYLAYFTKLNQDMIRLLSGSKQGASASGRSAGAGTNADMLALALQNPTLASPSFRNASGDGQELWKGVSYEQLANAVDRGVALDPVFGGVSSADPDLSAFKASGGKFLSWHGWNDESIPVQHTMRYYDDVMRTMGGQAKVEDFFKLYIIPGGGHGSPHGTSNLDAHPPAVAAGQLYALMIDWVEKGVEPKAFEFATPANSPVKRTAPACAYPRLTTYVSGDPDIAASYTCR